MAKDESSTAILLDAIKECERLGKRVAELHMEKHRLHAALEKHGRHSFHCGHHIWTCGKRGSCTCGLAEALTEPAL